MQFSTNIKSPEIWDSSLKFVQSIFDIGNLFHCFILFCGEQSNLNVGRFVNIVLLDRDTNLSSIVSYYVIHFVAIGIEI